MSLEFRNRVAIVTGGSTGIGRACALAFASRGAKVVVADIQEEESRETVRMIESALGTAMFVRCDVSRSIEVEAMVKKTVDVYGRLDHACNNAGIEGTQAPAADYPEQMWDRVIGVNLTGVWLCSDAASFITGHPLLVDGGYVAQ